MSSHDRDENLSELISARALHPDMPLPDGVTAEEWAEVVRLAEVENALWDAAHGAPPIEQDPVAAMLGLVPDQHLVLDGKALARARQAAGMTTSGLAARLLGRGWDAPTREVFRWETQGGGEVPPALINAIAEELGTTAARIATDKGPADAPDTLEEASHRPRFQVLVERFAKVRGISPDLAPLSLRAVALATVHRGSKPDADQWLETLEAYVSALEERREP